MAAILQFESQQLTQAPGQAAAGLGKLPLNLGDWQGENLPLADEGKTAMAGTLSRRYVHRTTGKTLSIYVGCGRPGPTRPRPARCRPGCG